MMTIFYVPGSVLAGTVAMVECVVWTVMVMAILIMQPHLSVQTETLNSTALK